MNYTYARGITELNKYSCTRSKPVNIKQASSVTNILQAKLKIGPSNDRYEQEADRVADQVMRMPESSNVQRKKSCAGNCQIESRENLTEQIQSKPASVSTGTGLDTPASINQTLSSPGRPLDSSARTFFESRFSQDFSDVRIHSDIQASNSAREINARAYTAGRDVVFADREYQPHSNAGRHLIAHELTHVIQQGHSKSDQTIQRAPFGIRLPTGMRFLDATEESILRGVYGSSLIYGKILLSDALGGGGRPFTLYMSLPLIGGVTVIQIGPTAYGTPGSNPGLLIHEAAHSWQSQHHPSGAAYMANSIASQAAAAAAGASAYCYVTGKWFGFYAAEQVAEQAEDGISAIRSHMSSVGAGSTDAANIASLAVPRWEVSGAPGVSC